MTEKIKTDYKLNEEELKAVTGGESEAPYGYCDVCGKPKVLAGGFRICPDPKCHPKGM